MTTTTDTVEYPQDHDDPTTLILEAITGASETIAALVDRDREMNHEAADSRWIYGRAISEILLRASEDKHDLTAVLIEALVEHTARIETRGHVGEADAEGLLNAIRS